MIKVPTIIIIIIIIIILGESLNGAPSLFRYVVSVLVIKHSLFKTLLKIKGFSESYEQCLV